MLTKNKTRLVTWCHKAALNSSIDRFITTLEVTHFHVKMLSGDYLCYSYLGCDRHQDASCRLFLALSPHKLVPEKDMVHLLTGCWATRTMIIPYLLNLISQDFRSNDILKHLNHKHLTQRVLDPTSLNLQINISLITLPCPKY